MADALHATRSIPQPTAQALEDPMASVRVSQIIGESSTYLGRMAQVWNIWKFGHKPFQEAGTDTFVLATPQGNLLWTCDPSVCSQLGTQHPKSQIAVNMLKFFEVYGPTVGSVEGDEWKSHRRVIVSGFNPSTNAAVWKETTQQTSALVDRWLEQGSIVPVMKHWTSRLALHVISAVFFRKSLDWDEYTRDFEPAPPGHQLSYEQALFTVLARLGILYVTPRALLGILPMKCFREAPKTKSILGM